MQAHTHTSQPAEETDDCHRFEYDPAGSATLTATLVHALSAVADVDVSHGEFSLYDCIDPEALERIFAPKADGSVRSGGYVAFRALDHEVYVYASGKICIHPPSR